jgi:mRNA interferase MazF
MDQSHTATDWTAVSVQRSRTGPSASVHLVVFADQAAHERRRIVEEAGPDTRAIGIEVFFGAEEGMAESGVVRVALPQDGRIFCTWSTTVSEDSLIKRIGTLTPAKRHELEVALALAGRE